MQQSAFGKLGQDTQYTACAAYILNVILLGVGSNLAKAGYVT
jgi:hypothetical protein